LAGWLLGSFAGSNYSTFYTNTHIQTKATKVVSELRIQIKRFLQLWYIQVTGIQTGRCCCGDRWHNCSIWKFASQSSNDIL